VISESQLTDDLFALMRPVFQESTLTPPEKQKMCDDILQQLIDLLYLQPKVVGTGKATQQEGYELGKVAKDSMKNHELKLAEELARKEAQERQEKQKENEMLTNQEIEQYIENTQIMGEEDTVGQPVTPEPQIPDISDLPIQEHPTASQEFIDGVSSLVTRLTTIYIFGMSRWKNDGIEASYDQLDKDLTNVEEHLAPFQDRYSVMVLDGLQKFHQKLMEHSPGNLTDDQYESLMKEYEVIPMRLC
jgi:hypothetical protein